jgi:hypothetical protein
LNVLVDAQILGLSKHLDPRSNPAKRLAWWDVAVRSDSVSNLMMAWQS